MRNVVKVSLMGMVVATSALLMAIGGRAAQAEDKAPAWALPQTRVGFQMTVLGSDDLGGHFAAMKGHALTMGRETVAPGGLLPTHAHGDRPEIIYILQGVLTEQRNNEPPKDYPPGSALVMTADVAHALSNRTASPVVYICAFIQKQG